MPRFLVLALAISMAFGGQALSAGSPRTLSWDDLIPDGAVYPPDPLASLTPEQQGEVGFVFRMQSAAAGAGLASDHELAQEAREISEDLQRQGIDLKRLTAQLKAWEAERKRVDRAIATSLDGAQVRLPGYVLPLEHEGEKLISFMLVPYVGACIHVPPPPANQMVHVTVDVPIPDKGLFAPVWVTGRLNAQKVESKPLNVSDGTINVSYGYTMEAMKVELYRE